MELHANQAEQDNELIALKAIYGDDIIAFTSNTESAKDWAPLECIIRTHLLSEDGKSQQNSPCVHLHVKCSIDYPQVPPTIKLENWERISNANVNRLQAELRNFAETLKGQVMIFQLVSYIENFLHGCKHHCYASFYDEMVARVKSEEEVQRQLKEAENEKKKQQIKAEIQLQEQVVKKALRRRQSSFRSGEEEPIVPVQAPSPTTSERLSDPSDKTSSDNMSLNLNLMKQKEEVNPLMFCERGESRFEHEFENISLLGTGAFGHVMKVRNKLDGCCYAVKRITLDPLEKQLNKKIIREVKFLSRLNHENVVRYYNSWIESTGDLSPREKERSSSDGSQTYISKKNLGDEVIELLPHNEPSLDWASATSSSEDEDDIVTFRNESCDKIDSENDGSSKSSGKAPSSASLFIHRVYMYIQMELCDKSTLRIAIDDGLYSDLNRVWRLFREIVEGLCHIHQQGIIHRDLKPVNIFIGHDDHVKIGDFGLATTILLQKHSARDTSSHSEKTQTQSSQQTDISLTGHVGTALYIAPELNSSKLKYSYNQKVDIYSLGVIFFEMCSAPISTGMERIQILTDLRQPEPVFPMDYPFDDNSPQRRLIRSMLQYDAEKRPSAQELLQNSVIPPPKREEREVSLMIKRTLDNPQSRNYKYLISSCFEQAVQPSLDATYNVSSWRTPIHAFSSEIVTNKLRTIFQNHGAVSLLPPLFTPAGNVPESSVCLMTRFGSIVHVTHDLLTPFARFLAQNPGVNQMKRYGIDKVYKERPAGVHPKESYECGFDIITQTAGDLLPEYEVICVLWEILKEFPSISGKNCVIYINHSIIVRIMLKVAGIDETKITSFFRKFGAFHSKNDIESYLKLCGLSDRNIGTLIQWTNVEGPLNKVEPLIMSLLKGNEFVSELKEALIQLELIYNFTQVIGISCPVLVNIGHLRNAHYYSGLMIQVACTNIYKNKQNERSVLLSGGRYDRLVQSIRESQTHDDSKVHQYVIGITLSIDKFIYCVDEEEKTKFTDVLVCAIGKISVSHDKLILLHDLWKSGLKASFIVTVESLEEIQSRCKGMGIPAIVLLKETDSGFARVRTYVKDRYIEKKINYNELLDYIWKYKASLMEANSSLKPELKSQPSSEGPVFTFITLEKLTPAVKRRYESNVFNNLQTLLPKFSSKVKVEIVALTVDSEVTRSLCQHIDQNCNVVYANQLLKRFPKYKKVIQKFLDHMDDAKTVTLSSVFIIYSLNDNVYNVVM